MGKKTGKRKLFDNVLSYLDDRKDNDRIIEKRIRKATHVEEIADDKTEDGFVELESVATSSYNTSDNHEDKLLENVTKGINDKIRHNIGKKTDGVHESIAEKPDKNRYCKKCGKELHRWGRYEVKDGYLCSKCIKNYKGIFGGDYNYKTKSFEEIESEKKAIILEREQKQREDLFKYIAAMGLLLVALFGFNIVTHVVESTGNVKPCETHTFLRYYLTIQPAQRWVKG